MFDSFFCDNINGHELYSGDEDEWDGCPVSESRNNYIKDSAVETTYDVYGIELRQTKKAVLYHLVCTSKDSYKLGVEKWLPKSFTLATHISEFDKTSKEFTNKFMVSGIDDLNIINIPKWLMQKDEVLRDKKKVFSVMRKTC
jgi:hypothetical protein